MKRPDEDRSVSRDTEAAAGKKDGEWEYRPARGYSWEPFREGNAAALRHGAYSPARIEPIASELVDAVLAAPTTRYLADPTYRPALDAWARAEAQVQLLTGYLAAAGEQSGDGVGDLDEDRIKAAYLLLHRAETRAATQRARLGLDPLSRARLGKDVASAAIDVAQLMAQGSDDA